MGNHGKGGGASYASRDRQMAAFDRLPRSIRMALANAYEDWAAFPIQRRWEQGVYANAKALIKTIAQWDETQRQRDRLALTRGLNRTTRRRPR